MAFWKLANFWKTGSTIKKPETWHYGCSVSDYFRNISFYLDLSNTLFLSTSIIDYDRYLWQSIKYRAIEQVSIKWSCIIYRLNMLCIMKFVIYCNYDYIKKIIKSENATISISANISRLQISNTAANEYTKQYYKIIKFH